MRSRSFPALAAAGAVLAGLALTGCSTGSTEAAETPDAAVKMAHGALAHSRPDAAERLAEMVEQLKERRAGQ